MSDPELFYHGEGGCGYEAEIEEEEIPEVEEFQDEEIPESEEEINESDGWMQGWYPSRNKPTNLCKYVRGRGLATVFPYGNVFKLVVDGQFFGPFFTQQAAQRAAKNLKS